MADREFVPVETGGGIGTLPDGEKHWYTDEDAYNQAYYKRLNIIVDEIYDAFNEFYKPLPEEWVISECLRIS